MGGRLREVPLYTIRCEVTIFKILSFFRQLLQGLLERESITLKNAS